jgi:hypothetical protein
MSSDRPYHHGDLAPSLRQAAREILEEEGLAELRGEIAQAAAVPADRAETIVRVGRAYMRFAVRHAGLLRLMFGSEIPNRTEFTGLTEATAAIGDEIGQAIGDSAAGLAVWSTIHGLATLILENVIDLGQTQAGMDVVPSRAEIILRSLTEALNP